MNSELERLIRSIPPEEFQNPGDDFAGLSPLDRIRWIQQTAWFVWKFGGAARKGEGPPPGDGTAR